MAVERLPISRHWQQLRPLLDEALDLAPQQRAVWFDALQIEADLKSALRQALSHSDTPHPLLDGAFNAAALLHEATDPVEHWIGKTVGRWRITGLLGQGGMATVFAAERSTPPLQSGALKLMQHGLFTEMEREQFRREQDILAHLEHPGVARLIDAGLSDDGIPFLVMEPVSGRAIDRHVRETGAALRERIALMARACDIVAYAQRALVVHRDLKPEHIVITADAQIKILDFGIAKLLGEARHTLTHARLGTPRYAAPEQISGGLVTTATDVFALGQITRELLHDLPARLPRDLDAILLQACQSDPEQRYPSAAELAADLRRWLAQRPVRARRIGALTRAAKYLRRHWIPASAAAAVLLSLVLGTVAARREAERADAAALNAQSAQSQAESALARARALNEFVVGLFRADIADVPRDQMPSTRQIVDAGIERARDRTSGPDELRAEMLVTLSQILRSRVQFDEAAVLVDEALALLEPIAESQPSLYADALLSRAATEIGHKDLEAAAVYFDRAIKWTHTRLPGTRLDLEARREIALNDFRRGNVARARERLESIDRDLLARPELADLRLKVATDLAIMYANSGEMARATQVFTTVLELKRATPGTSTVSVISALNNLASAHSLIGEFGPSERYYDEASELLAQLDDTPLQVRAAVWRGKSENAQRQGLFAQAREQLETSAELWRQALALDSVDDDYFLPYYRGLLWADAEQREDAIRDLQIAEQRMLSTPEARPSERETVRVTQARLHCEMGDVTRGTELLQGLPAEPGAAVESIEWNTREALARCALQRGEAGEAARWLGDGELVEHPLAVGLGAVSARRQLLRAEIALAGNRADAARLDLQGAAAHLDRIGVDAAHPLRRALATLQDRLARPPSG